MESLEKPDDRVDQQDRKEQLDPSVGEHPREEVWGSDVDFRIVGREGDVEVAVVGRREDE